MAKDPYDLDDVANVSANFGVAPIPFDKSRGGDASLDNVESVETSASLTHKDDSAWPTGKPVELDAVTEVDGSAKLTDMWGDTGTVAGKEQLRGWKK